MKKLLVFSLTLMLTTAITTSNSSIIEAKMNPSTNKTISLAKENNTLDYRGALIAVLMPYIDKAIENFYKDYYSFIPYEDPWSVKILSIERPKAYNASNFIIKLEVMPYIGPHNSVGRDQITFALKYSSEPKVEEFKHLENFELPPNYQDKNKKSLPPISN